MADSVYLEVLEEHCDDLELALKNSYEEIIEQLYLAGLLPTSVYNRVKDPMTSGLSPRQKATMIVINIKDKVQIKQSNYHKFIGVLKKRRYYEDVVENMNKTCYGKEI